MANPKRRFSKSRTAMRRSILWKDKAPTVASCPRCKQPRQPHRVCRNCGYYAGREILSVGE